MHTMVSSLDNTPTAMVNEIAVVKEEKETEKT